MSVNADLSFLEHKILLPVFDHAGNLLTAVLLEVKETYLNNIIK